MPPPRFFLNATQDLTQRAWRVFPAMGAGQMSTHVFTPQDACGGRCRIQVPRNEEGAQASRATAEAHPF